MSVMFKLSNVVIERSFEILLSGVLYLVLSGRCVMGLLV